VLGETSVTTLSGRQAQIQTADALPTIVVSSPTNVALLDQVTISPNRAGTITHTTIVTNVPTPGLTFDVIPYVSADEFTIQMTIIPTITEFLAYDDPGKFNPQAQPAPSGQGGVAVPITGVLPLPHFRVHQVTTSATVRDGQTVAIGDLVPDKATQFTGSAPGKATVLGGSAPGKAQVGVMVPSSLPKVAGSFRGSNAESKRLLVLVTPTIIDPVGNRVHTDEEVMLMQRSQATNQPPAGSR
jgi:Flp pilus assembly secretin CpaC